MSIHEMTIFLSHVVIYITTLFNATWLTGTYYNFGIAKDEVTYFFEIPTYVETFIH